MAVSLLGGFDLVAVVYATSRIGSVVHDQVVKKYLATYESNVLSHIGPSSSSQTSSWLATSIGLALSLDYLWPSKKYFVPNTSTSPLLGYYFPS